MNITEQVQALLDGLNTIERAYIAENFPMLTPDTHTCDFKGRKYLRIVREGRNQRFVEMFVERATGDVYYAAGWAGPNTKHVRFNIAIDDGLQTLLAHKWLQHYGYLYLDTIARTARFLEEQRNRELVGLLSPVRSF